MNNEMRLIRVEAVCNQIRGEMDDVLQKAYQAACEAQDEEGAAALARRIRNRLLEVSDKECVLDKVLPDAPTGITFSAWMDWLKQLANVAKNEWGVYRQSLRDLTTQEGFPFNIEWPVAPDAEKEEIVNDE